MCDDHGHAIHEVCDLEERLAALREQVESLDIEARIQQVVGEVIAASKKTSQAIIGSLEQRSGELYVRQPSQSDEDYEFAMRIADELANVATGIKHREAAP